MIHRRLRFLLWSIICITILSIGVLFTFVNCSKSNYVSTTINKNQSIDSTLDELVNFNLPSKPKWDTIWVQPNYMTKTWFIYDNKHRLRHQFIINELDSINIVIYRRLR